VRNKEVTNNILSGPNMINGFILLVYFFKIFAFYLMFFWSFIGKIGL